MVICIEKEHQNRKDVDHDDLSCYGLVRCSSPLLFHSQILRWPFLLNVSKNKCVHQESSCDQLFLLGHLVFGDIAFDEIEMPSVLENFENHASVCSCPIKEVSLLQLLCGGYLPK